MSSGSGMKKLKPVLVVSGGDARSHEVESQVSHTNHNFDNATIVAQDLSPKLIEDHTPTMGVRNINLESPAKISFNNANSNEPTFVPINENPTHVTDNDAVHETSFDNSDLIEKRE